MAEINSFLTIIDNEIAKDDTDIVVIAEAAVKITEYASEMNADEIASIVKDLKKCITHSNYIVDVFLYSIMIGMKKTRELHCEFLQYLYDNRDMANAEVRNYLRQQCERIEFANIELKCQEGAALFYKIYRGIVEEYAELFSDILEPIPVSERTENLVFVITDQYLTERHSTTRMTALYCRILMERLKKKVLLINTAEVLTSKGSVPFYGAWAANYLEQLSAQSEVIFENCHIPFFQCDNNMPDIDTIRQLLKLVKDKKPEYIINVADGGITGSLMAMMVPTLSLSMANEVVPSNATYQLIDNVYNLSDVGKRLLMLMGKDISYLIRKETCFAHYGVDEVYKREKYGIPEDAFVGTVVSTRIESEIGMSFWNIISDINDERLCILLIGNVSEKYIEKVYNNCPKLEGKIYTTGHVSGLLGCYSVCDIYINPPRMGGGSSAADALYKGIPVVTLKNCDVSVAVGDDEMCLDDISQMPEMIKRYMKDETFYKEMSEKSLERGKVIFDVDASLSRALREFEIRVAGM